MLRTARWTAVAILLFSAAGCATTMTVSSHTARGLDLARYRTWDWGPADALPTGDPRLDQNAFFQDHVQGAVEKAMAAKGFAMSASGTADLLLHYHASITRRIDVNVVDRGRGYCQGRDCWDDVLEYEAGTLVLDVVDARANTVIWRGWAQDSVEAVLVDPERMARKINEAVPRILASFR